MISPPVRGSLNGILRKRSFASDTGNSFLRSALSPWLAVKISAIELSSGNEVLCTHGSLGGNPSMEKVASSALPFFVLQVIQRCSPILGGKKKEKKEGKRGKKYT